MKVIIRGLVSLALVFGASLVLFFAVYGAGTILSIDNPPKFRPSSSGEIASWFQAIGAIGAIFGAYCLGVWQAGQARRLANDMAKEGRAARLRQHRELLLAALTPPRIAAQLLTTIELQPYQEQWRSQIAVDLDASLTAINSIPIQETGDARQIYTAILARSLVKSLIDQITIAMHTNDDQAARYHNLQTAIAPSLLTQITGVRDAIEAAARAVIADEAAAAR